jgi:hypothetical protein
MTSWVKTTCPPGWHAAPGLGDRWVAYRVAALEDECDGRGFAYPRDGDGRIVWPRSKAAACRQAWERWALDVLGGRLRWVTEEETGFQFLEVSGVGAAWPSDAGPALCDDAAGVLKSVSDPVEALARLAAMTLAELGPEVEP